MNEQLLKDLLDQDLDPVETREWIESLTAVIGADGPERAHYLLERMVDEPVAPAATCRSSRPPTTSTPSRRRREAQMPGDAAIEWRIRSMLRWNAMAMVVRANRKPGELGGHIACFASQRHALRRRLQPLLARRQRRAPR